MGFSCPRTGPAHPPAMWAGPWEGGCEKGAAHTRMRAESLCLESRRALTRVMPAISELMPAEHGWRTRKSHPSAQQPSQLHLQPQKSKAGTERASRQKLDFIKWTLHDDSGSLLYLEFTFHSGSGTSSAAAAPSLQPQISLFQAFNIFFTTLLAMHSDKHLVL